MQDRRNNVRARSFLGGKIIFNNRCASIDCLVRNLSANGARIVLGDTIVVPEKFELYIPQKGRSFRALMRWRTDSEVGVRFIAEADWDSEPIEFTMRLKRLEAENAALNARVAQLSSAE